jgi:hypothetical protein
MISMKLTSATGNSLNVNAFLKSDGGGYRLLRNGMTPPQANLHVIY